MSPIDLLWLFIIITSLQPVFRHRPLQAQRMWLELYRQASQRRPTVEFVPQPYRPPERRSGGQPASGGGDR